MYSTVVGGTETAALLAAAHGKLQSSVDNLRIFCALYGLYGRSFLLYISFTAVSQLLPRQRISLLQMAAAERRGTVL